MRLRLAALFAALAVLLLPLAAMCATDDDDKRFTDDVQRKMDAELSILSRDSYVAEGRPTIQAVDRSKSLSVPVTLAAGTSYAVIAACDQDCGHIRVELVAPTKKVSATSTEVHHTILLGGTPEQSGRHTIKVTLVKCREEQCYVGVALARQGAVSEAPPTTPTGREFRVLENFDLSGKDLRTLKDVSAAECAKACVTNKDCVGYSADKWNRFCFLKSEIATRRLDPRASSGQLSSLPEPPSTANPAKMLRLRDRAFPWAGQQAIGIDTFEQCETGCAETPSCVAFTFFKDRRLCRLMELTDEYFSDPKADSGYKQQER